MDQRRSRRLPDNISNQQFNYLTALKCLGRRPSRTGKRGSIYWLFKCVCGRECEMPSDNVRNGSTKSCGCKKRDLIAKKKRLPGGAGILNLAYAVHLYSAKRRNIPSFLSRDEYVNIIKKPCRYCGGFSERRTQKSGSAVIKSNSADRINNEPYYKIENTVPACFTCQSMKGILSENTFLAQAAKIAASAR